MELILAAIAVFSIALIELWAAVPAGFAMQMHPVATFAMAAGGAMSGAVLVSLLGQPALRYVMEAYKRQAIKILPSRQMPDMTGRIWQRFGVVGLGLIAPVVTGAPLGMALGLSLGAPTRRLFYWMLIGIMFWSAFLTLTAAGSMALLDLPQIEMPATP